MVSLLIISQQNDISKKHFWNIIVPGLAQRCASGFHKPMNYILEYSELFQSN